MWPRWSLPDRATSKIAAELGVSVRTVEGHLYRIVAKAEVTDRAQLRSEL